MMMRRNNRRGSNRQNPRDGLLSALSGGSVFTADNCTVSGGNITGFVDWLDPTHSLSQNTEASQVLAPTADAALGGRGVSTLFSTGKTYLSNRAANTWKRLHDGTGGGMCLIWVPQTVPASTSNCYLVQTTDSTPKGGVLLNAVFVSSSTRRTTSLVIHSNTASVVNQAYSTTAYTAGSGHVWRFRYKEGTSPEAEAHRFGVQVTSGDSAVAPDTGNPLATLTLGGTTVQSGWAWKFHALIIPPLDWTAGQIAAVNRYAQSLGLAGG